MYTVNMPEPVVVSPSPPVADDTLSDLPIKARVKTGVGFKGGGMWLDYSNGEVITNPQEVRLQTGADCNLVGWAFDVDATQPLKALYVKAGGALFECNYGIKRTSVSNYFKNQDLINTGFSVTIPGAYLVGVSEVDFIMLNTDGSYLYESVAYPVKGKDK
jgi:hypothetical protein